MSLPVMSSGKLPSETPMTVQPMIMKMLDKRMTLLQPNMPAKLPVKTEPIIWLMLTTLAVIKKIVDVYFQLIFEMLIIILLN